MIIDRNNYKQLVKVGLKFRIDYNSIARLDMRDDIKRVAKNNVICIVDRFGTEFGAEASHVHYVGVDRTQFGGTLSNVDRFSRDGMKWITVEDCTDNKNRKECFNCGCKTIMRRDFKDFTIREFCPRCKI